MSLVECTTLYGLKKSVPADQLMLRASAYALIIHEGNILLLRGRFTGKYALPGGGIELGEHIEDALQREVREEAGLEVRIERFLAFTDNFFYYDPLDLAIHGFLSFYFCTPLSFDLVADADVDDSDVEKPRWIPIDSLRAADFQSQGDLIISLLQQLGFNMHSAEQRMIAR